MVTSMLIQIRRGITYIFKKKRERLKKKKNVLGIKLWSVLRKQSLENIPGIRIETTKAVK